MADDTKPPEQSEGADDATPAGSAIVRAMRVMETIASSPVPPQLAEICKAVALPKPTVFRILATLEAAGLVGREPGSKRYHCGRRLSALAGEVLLNSPTRAARRAILEELVEHTGETCNLTIPNGNAVMYLDRVETAWPLRIALGAGSSVPLHASASGKLLLSLLPLAQRKRLLEQITLRGYTENTLVDRRALERDLEATRSRRVGINREEHLVGMYGIAVPVMLDRRRACAAVALQAPAGRATIDALMGHVPRLEAAAGRIARTFGAKAG